jgi:hypothetical protein
MPSRRDVIEGAAALAALGLAGRAAAGTDALTVQTDADIDRILPQISNWGRWGPDDQLGALNYITPELRLEAIRSVQKARVVSLAHERPVADPTGVRRFRYQNCTTTTPCPRRRDRSTRSA